jgi:nicotinamidase-related amidase
MKKALIIIDLQNDYFCGGNMELVNINEALNNANKLIKLARLKGYKIYIIQHFSTKKDASFFVENTNGVKLHRGLNLKDDLIIKKNYPNSFRNTILQEELQKRKYSKFDNMWSNDTYVY